MKAQYRLLSRRVNQGTLISKNEVFRLDHCPEAAEVRPPAVCNVAPVRGSSRATNTACMTFTTHATIWVCASRCTKESESCEATVSRTIQSKSCCLLDCFLDLASVLISCCLSFQAVSGIPRFNLDEDAGKTGTSSPG